MPFSAIPSIFKMVIIIHLQRQHFRDTSVLGGFLDNHDNARFLHGNGDYTALKNALAYTLMSQVRVLEINSLFFRNCQKNWHFRECQFIRDDTRSLDSFTIIIKPCPETQPGLTIYTNFFSTW